jgi:formyltetrahydrofolate-dependent phosphoribosylglycinamide formyltransferase
MPARIAVLASGGGTNLQALIDHFQGRADSPARVELVVASRPGIRALERAERAAIATVVLGAGSDSELASALEEHRIDLVVLAGYLQHVPDEVVETFRGRILNIHPALLPGFGGTGMYGIRVHRAVLEAGVRVTGATVHLVDERYDEGSILAQWPVPVLPGDSPETLAERVLRVEHLLLPAAVEAFASGGDLRSLVDPCAFELISARGPAPASIARVAAATCKPSS